MILASVVSTQYPRVTDWPTDRQTDRHLDHGPAQQAMMRVVKLMCV